jgi:hypothetical protein
MNPTLDDRDLESFADRAAKLAVTLDPQVGDFIEFADGIMRRISYIWHLDDGNRAQTSDGGSFYLGDGYVSFSGSLYPGVPVSSLNAANLMGPGRVWIFHHDHHTAHNRVEFFVPFRVWTSCLRANN